MVIRNNLPHGRNLHYKIGNETIKFFIDAYTEVNIPDLTDESQIVFNTFERRLRHIEAKTGENLNNSFTTPSDAINANIVTYSIPEQLWEPTIDGISHSIMVFVPLGTVVTNLTPTFTLSQGAISNPTSGTPDDFTSPVTIRVTSGNRDISIEWVVTVVEYYS